MPWKQLEDSLSEAKSFTTAGSSFKDNRIEQNMNNTFSLKEMTLQMQLERASEARQRDREAFRQQIDALERVRQQDREAFRQQIDDLEKVRQDREAFLERVRQQDREAFERVRQQDREAFRQQGQQDREAFEKTENGYKELLKAHVAQIANLEKQVKELMKKK